MDPQTGADPWGQGTPKIRPTGLHFPRHKSEDNDKTNYSNSSQGSCYLYKN